VPGAYASIMATGLGDEEIFRTVTALSRGLALDDAQARSACTRASRRGWASRWFVQPKRMYDTNAQG